MRYLVKIEHLLGLGKTNESYQFENLEKAKDFMLNKVNEIILKAKTNNNEIKILKPHYWDYALSEREKTNGLLIKHYFYIETFC